MARPSPSRFKKFTAWPVSAHHFLQSIGQARLAHHVAARPMKHRLYRLYGPARKFDGPLCCSVIKRACSYADVVFYVNSCFSLFSCRLDSVGELLSTNETHTTSTH